MALDNTALVALDLETTGLNPRSDRVRLISLACDTIDGETFTYLVDCFALDPTPLWEALAEKELVIHNAAFDLVFLARLGFTPAAAVHDTMLLAQLLVAGTQEKVTLAACCRRWLGRDLDKAEQKSDWTGRLTEDQRAYAAADAEVLRPLLAVLRQEIGKARLDRVAEIERRCQPAVLWMAGRGVAFDRNAWLRLAGEAAAEEQRIPKELDRQAPARPGTLAGLASWNWDSQVQVKEALALAGCPVESTDDDTLAALEVPLAGLLRRYREARKRSSTSGAGWLKHVGEDGRVYPQWRQMGAAASGRMSCGEPNMQQLPRGEYRRCVMAPPGRLLVKADYSQVELRIAAKIAGEARMIDAYRRGDDLHVLTAARLLGKPLEQVTKADRQIAKSANFGLLDGMGAAGYRIYARSNYGLDLTEEQAAGYRKAFFETYPGLVAWHRSAGRSGKGAVDTRTLTGRRRLNVSRFTERLNTPVQGTGADGLKLALALLWERRDQCPGAFPVLAVHDEIVVECDQADAEKVSAWLQQAMQDGMAPLVEPVPVEVEMKTGRAWGVD
jgi:DNA polymerase-1